MNAREFDENILPESVKAIDPLHDSHSDFPYDDVEAALGGRVDEIEEMDAATCAKLGAALLALARWVVDVQLKKDAHRIIGLRAIAFAWVLKPDLFFGMSQTEIAKLIGAKNKMEISRHAAEFSRLFAVRNRGQSHGWNYADAPATAVQAPKARPVPRDLNQLPLFSE